TSCRSSNRSPPTEVLPDEQAFPREPLCSSPADEATWLTRRGARGRLTVAGQRRTRTGLRSPTGITADARPCPGSRHVEADVIGFNVPRNPGGSGRAGLGRRPARPEAGVATFVVDELLVGAELDDAAVVDDRDTVGA